MPNTRTRTVLYETTSTSTLPVLFVTLLLPVAGERRHKGYFGGIIFYLFSSLAAILNISSWTYIPYHTNWLELYSQPLRSLEIWTYLEYGLQSCPSGHHNVRALSKSTCFFDVVAAFFLRLFYVRFGDALLQPVTRGSSSYRTVPYSYQQENTI